MLDLRCDVEILWYARQMGHQGGGAAEQGKWDDLANRDDEGHTQLSSP